MWDCFLRVRGGGGAGGPELGSAQQSGLGWVTFLQGYKAELGTNSIISKPAPTFG